MAARATVLGAEIDRLTLDETVRRCRDIVRAGGFGRQVSINAAKLVALREDPRLELAIRTSEIVSADGQPVVWASRLLGDPLPGRVNGTDLMLRLLALAEAEGLRVYILGARRDVLEEAVTRLREQYPRLVIAGYRDGYFSDEENVEVCAEIRASGAHVLFIAMSSPKKEYWLAERARDTGVRVAMGVGGSIDVVAGRVRRAPVWMQRAGLEWLFRLLQEPRRLGRRYTSTNARFLLLLARELVARRPAARSE